MSKRLAILLLLLLMPLAGAAQSIVVVVNPNSGVESLTRGEVINIFLGGFRQFPSGISAVPIDLPRASLLREQFYWRLVGKNSAEINTYWSRLVFSGKMRPPAEMESDEAKAMVLKSVNAITYLMREEVTEALRIVFELPDAWRQSYWIGDFGDW
jgi:ABC-type phosphate transport system substrate-binding protein